MVIFIVWIFVICSEQKELKTHEKVCGNKDFCGVVMLSEDRKTLQFNQYQKSDKTPSITYADPESLIKKVDGIKNNHF